MSLFCILDASLLRTFYLPVELREVVKTYLYMKITDRNIHLACTYYDDMFGYLTKKMYGSIEYWDTSSITNMSNLFEGNPDFHGDISNWDVSNVTNMDYMFFHNMHFNDSITGKWNMTNVESKKNMFFHIFFGETKWASLKKP